MNYEDDLRMIVWTLSAKGADPFVRLRKAEGLNPEVRLDLRAVDSTDFERKVSHAADAFYRVPERSEQGTLVIVGAQGARKIRGRETILNELAVIEPSGMRKTA